MEIRDERFKAKNKNPTDWSEKFCTRSLEAKKAKADAKAAEEAKKTEVEAVLKKLLAEGVSADDIIEKLK